MFLKVSLFAVLVLFLHQGDAIKCYECPDSLLSDCSGNTTTPELVECPTSDEESFYCTKIEFQVLCQNFLIKKCMAESKVSEAQDKCEKLGDTCQFNQCSDDACNSSTVLSSSAVLFLLVAAISYISPV